MGEVHKLDIEGEARVDGRILVGVLRDVRATVVGGREGDVQEVMVEYRIRAEQALQHAAHQRQVEELGWGAAGRVDFRERRSGRRFRDGGAGQGLAVDSPQLEPFFRAANLPGLG